MHSQREASITFPPYVQCKIKLGVCILCTTNGISPPQLLHPSVISSLSNLPSREHIDLYQQDIKLKVWLNSYGKSFEEEPAKECQTNSYYASERLQSISQYSWNESFKRYHVQRKGFPDRLTTNLVYTDTIILDPSAGTPCPNKTYTLNGCFDPDFSLGGTQPTYWDQLSLIYNRYKVKARR